MDNHNSPQSEYQGETYDVIFNPPIPPPSNNSNHSRDVKFQLPLDFSPSPYSVLVGRGKVCTEATGNKRLKVLVSTFLDDYSKSSSRVEKSITVSKIIDMVREACPVGAFIKREKGVWWEVSDCVARERVGAMLRDSLHEQYKSSSKSKHARRKSCKSSSGDARVEPPVAKQNKGSKQLSLVTSTGEGPIHWYSEGVNEQIYSPHLPDQSSASALIVNHSHLDDTVLAKIDATDVLIRKLPRESTAGKSFLKGEIETTSHLIDDIGNPKGGADPRLHHGPAWQGTINRNSFPDDPFQVFAQQQQLLELQLHRNRQRQSEQQFMYQQQQQQQLRHLQQQQPFYQASYFGPRSSYTPNMMPFDTALERPSLLQDPSSQSFQMGMLDPTVALPSGSLDAVALAMARSDANKSANTLDIDSSYLDMYEAGSEPTNTHNPKDG
jgi:hypothetical protein